MGYVYTKVRGQSHVTTSTGTANYGGAPDALINLLLSAGWVVKSSGSGTTLAGASFVSNSPTTVTLTSGTPGTVNWTGHGFQPNQKVYFSVSGGSLPAELSSSSSYFISPFGYTANSFRVSTTKGGSQLAFSTSGSGTIQAVVGYVLTNTATVKTATITTIISATTPAVVAYDNTPHGFNIGDPLRWTNVAPTGVTASATTVYVLSSGFTPYSFQYALTPEGAALSNAVASGTTSFTPITSWNNVQSWARIQDPGGGRELLIQMSTAGSSYVAVSSSTKFTVTSPAGAISSSNPPTATDVKVLRGSYNSSTGAITLDTNTSASWVVNCSGAPAPGAGSASTSVGFNKSGVYQFRGAASNTAPYGFWFAGVDLSNVSRAPSLSMIFDPVIGDSADPDPMVYYVGSGTGNLSALSTGSFGRDGSVVATWNIVNNTTGTTAPAQGSNGGTAFAWMGPMDNQANFVCVHPAGLAASVSSTTTPTILGIKGVDKNKFDGNWNAIPVPWVRNVNLHTTTIGITTGPTSSTITTNGTTTITWTGHTLQVNQMLNVTAAGTSGLSTTTIYYVTSVATNTFTMSTTIGGANVTAASGTVTMIVNLGGLKGWSTLCRWVGNQGEFGSLSIRKRTFEDTLDNNNWLCVGCFWLPWDGTLP